MTADSLVIDNLIMVKGKKDTNTPTLGQEILAVLGISLALFLFLCLASYSIPSQAIAPPSNWGGAVGNFIADVLMRFLGLSSFWLALLLFFFAIQFFSPRASFSRLPYIVLGCTGLLIASSGLLTILNSQERTAVEIVGHSFPLGGYLGSLLDVFLGTYFGGPGSVLLLLSIFVFSLMLAIRFSPYFMGLGVMRSCGRLWACCRPKMAGGGGEGKAEKAAGRFATARQLPLTSVEEGIAEVPNVNQPIRLIMPEDSDDDETFEVMPVSSGEYQLPGLGLLDKVDADHHEVDRQHYYEVSEQLEAKLRDFGVEGKVVGISPGPVVTTYEFSPAPGVKINKIVSLADDLAMGLKADSVRIVGSIPGKVALGIEIPNPQREIVYVRDILASEEFRRVSSKLSFVLGKDVVGKPVLADLAKMPHLLIAGATGAGKSVALNTIICSILFRATPDEVRLLMVDPKRIELSCYEDIPHLLHPVVVEPKMASRALQWAVREMERRYELLESQRVKSIESYNEIAEEKLPLIVIIVDELADLMMVSSRDVEDAIARLAQMARASGIHLILATQRPSVDVLTGLIKANFPTRISFKVSSKVDSRTILDASGAEHLLGAGDLLFLAPGTARLQRIHGAYISEQETERIASFLKEQGTAKYDESMLNIDEELSENGEQGSDEYDEKYDEAMALVCETGQASISMVQRRLRVGYNRAARMIEIMEKEGVIGPADGSKPREVLVRKEY